MIVETRKLDATDTEGDRIKVTAEDGATAEFGYPYQEGLDGREAHAWAVQRLFPAWNFAAPVWDGGTAQIHRFRVEGGEELAAMDKITMHDMTVPLEERRAAFRRHNRRTGTASGVTYDG